MMQLIKNLSEPKNLLVVCVLYTVIITLLFLVPLHTGTTSTIPIDKLVHFSLNGALVFLWGFYLTKKSGVTHWKNLLFVLLFAIIYGIIIEILQEELTTSRMADLWDVVANTLGCFAGLFFLKLFKIKFSS